MSQYNIQRVPAKSFSVEATNQQPPSNTDGSVKDSAEVGGPATASEVQIAKSTKPSPPVAEETGAVREAQPAKEPGRAEETAEDVAPKKDAEKFDKAHESMKQWFQRQLGATRAAKERTTQERDEARTLAAQRAAELDAAYRKLATLTTRAEEPVDSAVESTRPVKANYVSPADYAAAVADWSVERMQGALDKKFEEQRTRSEVAGVQKTMSDVWQQQVATAAQRYPDYADTVGNPNLHINEVMKQRIYASPVGAELAYYLGKNPETAKRIASMAPIDAISELSIMSYQLGEALHSAAPEAQDEGGVPDTSRATSAPPKPKLPSPIKPLAALRGAAVTKSPHEETMQEYAARREAEFREKRRLTTPPPKR